MICFKFTVTAFQLCNRWVHADLSASSTAWTPAFRNMGSLMEEAGGGLPFTALWRVQASVANQDVKHLSGTRTATKPMSVRTHQQTRFSANDAIGDEELDPVFDKRCGDA